MLIFNIIQKEYYIEALKLIPENSTLFLFSDDIEWLKDILKDRKYISISDKGLKDYEELSLMTLCHNFIIPNSTFSWWGAWLSSCENKIVISPKRWFIHKRYTKANNDIIPEKWIRL